MKNDSGENLYWETVLSQSDGKKSTIVGSGVDAKMLNHTIGNVHQFNDEHINEIILQVSHAKAWAIVKSILFQLEHDADFIEIAIVSKPEGANVDYKT